MSYSTGADRMKLDLSQVRYLGFAHVLIPILINAVICGLIGLVDYRNTPWLPIWGLPQSVALDLIATSFLLPTITCLIATPLTHRDMRRGLVGPISNPPFWLQRLPSRWLVRAVFLGGIGLATLGVACFCGLTWLVERKEIEREQFIVAKIVFACVYGTIVTPIVAMKAMSENVGDRSH